MVVDREFWNGRRVLVTGHTGFKGAWLCLWLQKLGARVAGFALEAPTSPSLFEIAKVAEGMQSQRGDVRDLDQLRSVVAEVRPEIIIHMAAQSLVRPSYADPVGTYATNVMGTVNVLEAARQVGFARVLINVTSDKCYENREQAVAYREGDAMGGRDPYSSSKGCSELVTAAYRCSFFAANRGEVAVASVRAGNVIGGGDWAVDRLIPDFFRASERDDELLIRSPAAIRPWQYVLDPLHGYLMLAQEMWRQPTEFADAWNFGPPEEEARPVAQVIELLNRSCEKPVRWRVSADQRLHEAHYLKLDCSKARSRLGWRSQVRLEGALEKIVDWYQGYRTGRDMRSATLRQIESYAKLAG
jgi:CDP-glucose 4,6-dehydratase